MEGKREKGDGFHLQ